jgi:hypothetical protein
MDLSRLLVLLLALPFVALAVTACEGRPGEVVIASMPTMAETADLSALQEFIATPPPPSPSPAATLPTSTPPPTATPSPMPTDTPTATPQIPDTPTPDPARQINGIPFEEIAVIPPSVAENVRQIAQRGEELGRNPRAFSKLGDSAVLVESNLTRFDNGPVTLGAYGFLQPTIEYFSGSWQRYGAGARVSLTTIGTFDPMWANPNYCPPGVHLLECEINLHNPAIILIRLGTNDGDADLYSTYMSRIIEFAIEKGVIPVLGTKADRFEGDDSINEATRRLAADYRVPLWDFDRLAETLPNRGLTDDQAHLTMYSRNDYSDPETFDRGYPMSDLSALVILDMIVGTLSANE